MLLDDALAGRDDGAARLRGMKTGLRVVFRHAPIVLAAIGSASIRCRQSIHGPGFGSRLRSAGMNASSTNGIAIATPRYAADTIPTAKLAPRGPSVSSARLSTVVRGLCRAYAEATRTIFTLPPRDRQLLREMREQRVGQPEIAFRVFEVDRIDLVRHGGGAAAAFAGGLEGFADIGLHHERNVARDLAAGAGDDGEYRGRLRDAVAVGVPGGVGQRQLAGARIERPGLHDAFVAIAGDAAAAAMDEAP